MRDFTNFRQNAISLPDKIAADFRSKQGCFNFFTAYGSLLFSKKALLDAITIQLIAQSLDEKNDALGLVDFFWHTKKLNPIHERDIVSFKNSVLTGAYLLIWSKYNSSVTHYFNQKMIGLLQHDSEIQSPLELPDEQFEACLESLGQYCAFIYEKRNEPIYTKLYTQLGSSIQSEIYSVNKAQFNIDSSLYGICSGIVSSIGL